MEAQVPLSWATKMGIVKLDDRAQSLNESLRSYDEKLNVDKENPNSVDYDALYANKMYEVIYDPILRKLKDMEMQNSSHFKMNER